MRHGNELLVIMKKFIYALLVAFFGNLMLNSSLDSYRSIEYLPGSGAALFSRIFGNAAGVFLMFLFLAAVFCAAKNLSAAVFISSTVYLIISLVSYYTLIFHGSVVTYEDVKNIGVTTRVIQGYDFSLSGGGIKIIIFYAILLAAALFPYIVRGKSSRKADKTTSEADSAAFDSSAPEKNRALRLMHAPASAKKRREWRSAGVWLLAACVFFVAAFVCGLVIPHAAPTSWEKYYLQHGFATGFIEYTLTNSRSAYKTPEGYDKTYIEKYGDAYEDAPNSSGSGDHADPASGYPDIIFILNESWCDLDRFSPLSSDADPMANYRALDAAKGYAVVANTGGGTNISEYEFLTANSAALVNTSSPFNNLDLTNCHSIVKYLRSIGYTTMAAHPAEGANYNRANAWPKLGFETTHFIEDFTDLEYSGKRVRATDSSAFRNFARFYEAMRADAPRFAYLLTIQNHGAWTFNPDEFDTVHVGNDTIWPSIGGDVNEYLSSVQLTDEFIPEMTDYFSNCGRDVVVVMVGDHAPSFITSAFNGREITEQALIRRETPYFIWTNYTNTAGGHSSTADGHSSAADEFTSIRPDSAGGPEPSVFSLCCLPAAALRAAGVPLAPYYSLVDELASSTLSLTSTEGGETSAIKYIDSSAASRDISDGSELSNKVRDYYFMEYQSLTDR